MPEEKWLLAMLNTSLELIDSPKKRQELVDAYINTLPKKLSLREKQELKQRLLDLPLNQWG